MVLRETLPAMVDIFELKPLIETDCFQSVKYDLNHLFDNVYRRNLMFKVYRRSEWMSY